MPIMLTDTGTTYTTQNAGVLAKLLVPVLKGKGRDLKELGGRLGAMIKPTSPLKEFGNLDELADYIISSYDAGKLKQAAGDDLENLAADYLGGSVAKGDTIPAWAVDVVKNNGNDADPDLYAGPGRTGATVKPDVWSDAAVGIVGGAAKADNLPKLNAICGQLALVCDAHNKTPLVFCTGDTPVEVLDTVAEHVGKENVLILQGDKSWKAFSEV